MFDFFKKHTNQMKHNQLADKVSENNIILTDDVKLSLDTAQTGKNLNVCVIGGAGTGKTRNYILPNILQANTSYVITDPSGYLLQETGKFLEEQGYKIKVLNLIDMEHSNHYNPFDYVYDKNGICDRTLVIKMVESILPVPKQGTDKTLMLSRIINDIMCNLVSAICFYLIETKSKENCNFENVNRLLNMSISELDVIFSTPDDEKVKFLCLKSYLLFRDMAKENAEAIRIAALGRLQAFNIHGIVNLTNYDDMELDLTGDRKTVIFITLPLSHNKFNFLSDMLLTQLLDILYNKAESQPNNTLPVHVRFMFDEFAHCVNIPYLERHMAVCSSKNISVNVILQCIEQLKTQCKGWDMILGTSDSILFFGSHSVETLKCFSDFIGNQISVDQLKTIDANKCVLNIRGLPPFYSRKFDVEKHINFKQLKI